MDNNTPPEKKVKILPAIKPETIELIEICSSTFSYYINLTPIDKSITRSDLFNKIFPDINQYNYLKKIVIQESPNNPLIELLELIDKKGFVQASKILKKAMNKNGKSLLKHIIKAKDSTSLNDDVTQLEEYFKQIYAPMKNSHLEYTDKVMSGFVVVGEIVKHMIALNPSEPLFLLLSPSVTSLISLEDMHNLINSLTPVDLAKLTPFAEESKDFYYKILDLTIRKDNEAIMAIIDSDTEEVQLNMNRILDIQVRFDNELIVNYVVDEMPRLHEKFRNTEVYDVLYKDFVIAAENAIVRGEVQLIFPFFQPAIWELFRVEEQVVLLHFLIFRGGEQARDIVLENVNSNGLIDVSQYIKTLKTASNSEERKEIVKAFKFFDKKILDGIISCFKNQEHEADWYQTFLWGVRYSKYIESPEKTKFYQDNFELLQSYASRIGNNIPAKERAEIEKFLVPVKQEYERRENIAKITVIMAVTLKAQELKAQELKAQELKAEELKAQEKPKAPEDILLEEIMASIDWDKLGEEESDSEEVESDSEEQESDSEGEASDLEEEESDSEEEQSDSEEKAALVTEIAEVIPLNPIAKERTLEYNLYDGGERSKIVNKRVKNNGVKDKKMELGNKKDLPREGSEYTINNYDAEFPALTSASSSKKSPAKDVEVSVISSGNSPDGDSDGEKIAIKSQEQEGSVNSLSKILAGALTPEELGITFGDFNNDNPVITEDVVLLEADKAVEEVKPTVPNNQVITEEVVLLEADKAVEEVKPTVPNNQVITEEVILLEADKAVEEVKPTVPNNQVITEEVVLLEAVEEVKPKASNNPVDKHGFKLPEYPGSSDYISYETSWVKSDLINKWFYSLRALGNKGLYQHLIDPDTGNEVRLKQELYVTLKENQERHMSVEIISSATRIDTAETHHCVKVPDQNGNIIFKYYLYPDSGKIVPINFANLPQQNTMPFIHSFVLSNNPNIPNAPYLSYDTRWMKHQVTNKILYSIIVKKLDGYKDYYFIDQATGLEVKVDKAEYKNLQPMKDQSTMMEQILPAQKIGSGETHYCVKVPDIYGYIALQYYLYPESGQIVPPVAADSNSSNDSASQSDSTTEAANDSQAQSNEGEDKSKNSNTQQKLSGENQYHSQLISLVSKDPKTLDLSREDRMSLENLLIDDEDDQYKASIEAVEERMAKMGLVVREGDMLSDNRTKPEEITEEQKLMIVPFSGQFLEVKLAMEFNNGFVGKPLGLDNHHEAFQMM